MLIDNYGLKLYNLTSLINNTFLNSTEFELIHPGVKKLDIVSNKYTNKQYLGISLKPNITCKEFFIELVVNNEFNPEFNKAFLSEIPVDYEEFTQMNVTHLSSIKRLEG